MRATKSTNSTNISIVGASDRTASAIELYFKRADKRNFEVVSLDVSSDILIADLDNFQKRELIVKAKQANPNGTVIYFSVKSDHGQTIQDALDSSAAQLIQKPLTHQKLSAALEVAVARLKASQNKQNKIKLVAQAKVEPINKKKAVTKALKKPVNGAVSTSEHYKSGDSLKVGKMLDRYSVRAFIGSLQNIVFSNEKQLKSARYKSELFLQRYLIEAARRAKQGDVIIQLSVSDSTISINPHAQLVKIDGNTSMLFSLAKMPMQPEQVVMSRTKERWTRIKGSVATIDSVLWHVTLLAARGRVPNDTDFSKRFRLKHWPNMTRLTLFPHALRVAALWSKGDHSLVETAGLLNIEHRFIFSFYAAAKAIGLIEMCAEQTSLTSKNEQQKILPENGKKRGLLARLLKHIRGH
jgi:AmiR/NasT family two-component response regulator